MDRDGRRGSMGSSSSRPPPNGAPAGPGSSRSSAQGKTVDGVGSKAPALSDGERKELSDMHQKFISGVCTLIRPALQLSSRKEELDKMQQDIKDGISQRDDAKARRLEQGVADLMREMAQHLTGSPMVPDGILARGLAIDERLLDIAHSHASSSVSHQPPSTAAADPNAVTRAEFDSLLREFDTQRREASASKAEVTSLRNEVASLRKELSRSKKDQETAHEELHGEVKAACAEMAQNARSTYTAAVNKEVVKMEKRAFEKIHNMFSNENKAHQPAPAPTPSAGPSRDPRRTASLGHNGVPASGSTSASSTAPASFVLTEEQGKEIWQFVSNKFKHEDLLVKGLGHFLVRDTTPTGLLASIFKTAIAREAVQEVAREVVAADKEAETKNEAGRSGVKGKRRRTDGGDAMELDTDFVARSDYNKFLQELSKGEGTVAKGLKGEWKTALEAMQDKLDGQVKDMRKEQKDAKAKLTERLTDHDTKLDTLEGLPRRFQSLKERIEAIEGGESTKKESVTPAALEQLRSSLKRDIHSVYVSKEDAKRSYAPREELETISDLVKVDHEDGDHFRTRVLCALGMSDMMQTGTDAQSRHEFFGNFKRYWDEYVDVGPNLETHLLQVLRSVLEKEEDDVEGPPGAFLHAVDMRIGNKTEHFRNRIETAVTSLARIEEKQTETTTAVASLADIISTFQEQDEETNTGANEEGQGQTTSPAQQPAE